MNKAHIYTLKICVVVVEVFLGGGGATLPVPYTPPPIPHFTYRPIAYLLC